MEKAKPFVGAFAVLALLAIAPMPVILELTNEGPDDLVDAQPA